MLTRSFGRIFLAVLLVIGLAPLGARAEVIDSFSSNILVNADGSATVKETIQYDFEGAQKHGIFRDIPVQYKDGAGVIEHVTIDDVSVSDENGAAYPFVKNEANGVLNLRIGDADVLVGGTHTYVISYVAHDVVGFFPDHDEIYWNVTGDAWNVSIKKAEAVVVVPSVVTQSSCYQGVFGSREPCVSNERVPNGYLVSFGSRILNPYEGLTVAVGFPKGAAASVSVFSRIKSILHEDGIILVPLVLLIVLTIMWWKIGRDAHGRGTIIPEYDAPPGLSPVDVAFLAHESVRTSDISAQIVGLAIGGYLTINRIESKMLGLFTSVDYRFDKKRADEPIDAVDARVLLALFEKGRDSVLTSELKVSRGLANAYSSITTIVDNRMKETGFYRFRVLEARGWALALSVVALITTKVLGKIVFGSEFVAALSLVACIGIGGLFVYLMPAKTTKGALSKDAILGLKEYLQIAEKNRLDFHNAPEKSPQLFEKLLPYAMVLGVSTAWAKEFEGIYTQSPSWYSGGAYHAFSAAAFVSDMSAFSTAATAVVSPQSGSGGSGGGGFSGGGFGGGGGGSW